MNPNAKEHLAAVGEEGKEKDLGEKRVEPPLDSSCSSDRINALSFIRVGLLSSPGIAIVLYLGSSPVGLAPGPIGFMVFLWLLGAFCSILACGCRISLMSKSFIVVVNLWSLVFVLGGVMFRL